MVVPLPGRDVGAPGSLSVLLVEDMAPRRRPRRAPQPLWQEAHEIPVCKQQVLLVPGGRTRSPQPTVPAHGLSSGLSLASHWCPDHEVEGSFRA